MSTFAIYHLVAIFGVMMISFAAGIWYDSNIRRLGTTKKQYSSGGAVTKKDFLDIRRTKKDGSINWHKGGL